MLAIALVGIAVAVRRQWKAPAGPQATALFMLQIWFFLPLVLCACQRPNIYDGMRHFLFLLPALSLWFGLGARYLATWPREPRRRALAAALVWIIALSPAAALVRLHPYQMTYFNSLVGGLQGAADSYETDYWVTSYKEALQWVNSQTPNERVRVLVAATEHCRLCAEHYRSGNVNIKFLTTYGLKGAIPEEYDYYIGTYRCKMADNFPESPIVKRIGRRPPPSPSSAPEQADALSLNPLARHTHHTNRAPPHHNPKRQRGRTRTTVHLPSAVISRTLPPR